MINTFKVQEFYPYSKVYSAIEVLLHNTESETGHLKKEGTHVKYSKLLKRFFFQHDNDRRFRAALASTTKPALAQLSAAVFFSVCLFTLDIFPSGKQLSHLLKA